MTDEKINPTPGEREYDFALIVGNVPELNEDVETALFEVGCDDATASIQYGRLYLEFSRVSISLKDAILSAIKDIRKALPTAEVLRVDECNLVSAADIARRIGRSRQLVFQYIEGIRGPGAFPPPECHLSEGRPLWAWCAVSYWLAQNDILKPEEGWNAEVVAAINNLLEAGRQQRRNAPLIKELHVELTPPCCE